MPIEFRALDAEINRIGFTCGDAEIDKWFRNHALKHHAEFKHLVTCATFDDEPNNIMGFYALTAVVEEAKKLPHVPFFNFPSSTHFPCIQLVYMAIRKDCQRQQHGTAVLAEIVRSFVEIGRLIGVPAMILTPINNDARRFYAWLGFEPYADRMFLGLEQAIATLAAAEAENEAEGFT